MSKLKTVNIKGKEYVEVQTRVNHFRLTFPNHSIITEVVEKTDDSILIKATIKDDRGITLSTGIASYEEVANAIAQQQDTITKFTLDIGDENWAKVLNYVVANKQLGMEKILTQLKKKYDIKAPIKKELSKLVK